MYGRRRRLCPQQLRHGRSPEIDSGEGSNSLLLDWRSGLNSIFNVHLHHSYSPVLGLEVLRLSAMHALVGFEQSCSSTQRCDQPAAYTTTRNVSSTPRLGSGILFLTSEHIIKHEVTATFWLQGERLDIAHRLWLIIDLFPSRQTR